MTEEDFLKLKINAMFQNEEKHPVPLGRGTVDHFWMRGKLRDYFLGGFRAGWELRVHADREAIEQPLRSLEHSEGKALNPKADKQ